MNVSSMQLDPENVLELEQLFSTLPDDVAVLIVVNSNWNLKEITDLCGISRVFRDKVCERASVWRALLLRDFDMSSRVDEMRYRDEAGKRMFAGSLQRHVEQVRSGSQYTVVDEQKTVKSYRYLYQRLNVYTFERRKLPIQLPPIDDDAYELLRAAFGTGDAHALRTMSRENDPIYYYQSGIVVLSVGHRASGASSVAIVTNVVDLLFEKNLFSVDYLRNRLIPLLNLHTPRIRRSLYYDEPGTVANATVPFFLDTGSVGLVPHADAPDYILINPMWGGKFGDDNKVPVFDPTSVNLAFVATRLTELQLLIGNTGQVLPLPMPEEYSINTRLIGAAAYGDLLAVAYQMEKPYAELVLYHWPTAALLDSFNMPQNETIRVVGFQRSVDAKLGDRLFVHMLGGLRTPTGVSVFIRSAQIAKNENNGDMLMKWVPDKLVTLRYSDTFSLFIGANTYVAIVTPWYEEQNDYVGLLPGFTENDVPIDVGFRIQMAQKRNFTL